MTERYGEIDVMKAAAIVAVVLIHSLRPFWEPGFTRFEAMISDLTRFAVPAFLAASGFLYYQAEPVTRQRLIGRLRRILFPYVCVSLAAYAYTILHPTRVGAASFLEGLLLGSTFGPYYYVFLLTEFVLATWLLSRLPPRVVACILVLLVVQLLVPIALLGTPETKGLGGIARSPRVWGVWFVSGWVAAAYRPQVMWAASQYRRRILLAWVLILAVWSMLFVAGALHGRASHVAAFVLVSADLIGLFTLAHGIVRAPQWVTELSTRTYALYLLHPFFVYAFQDIALPVLVLPLPAQILLSWTIGLCGAMLVTLLAQAALGERSRDLIGA